MMTSTHETQIKQPILDSRPFIGGQRVAVTGSNKIEKYCPATGRSLAPLTSTEGAVLDSAVSGAREAFSDSWCNINPDNRKSILLAIADQIEAHAQKIAHLDSVEMGKPITAAIGETAVAASYFRYYAEAIDKVYGKTAPRVQGTLETQVRHPRGVVAAITPWNFPSINAALKAAPVLAAGNSIVVKPSELASGSALLIAELAYEAGLPPGTFNVVPGGAKTGSALVAHTGVDLVTFTGSTNTGRMVMQESVKESLKPVLLECGGKSPSIVFADALDSADLSNLVAVLANAALWNTGQVCVAKSTIYIERSIYDQVLEALVSHCEGMVLGLPGEGATMLGPLASQQQYNKVLGAIEAAEATSAEIVLDGREATNPGGGYYVGPTIFKNMPFQSDLAQQEIFGPVIGLAPFDTAKEVLSQANNSPYGLAASIFTGDFRRAHELAAKIDAGKISVFARPTDCMPCWQAQASEPMKQSGFGVEGGMDAFDSYTTLKSVQFIYT